MYKVIDYKTIRNIGRIGNVSIIIDNLRGVILRLQNNYTMANYTAQIIDNNCNIDYPTNVSNCFIINNLIHCNDNVTDCSQTNIYTNRCTKMGSCSNNVCKRSNYSCHPVYSCDDPHMFYDCCYRYMNRAG